MICTFAVDIYMFYSQPYGNWYTIILYHFRKIEKKSCKRVIYSTVFVIEMLTSPRKLKAVQHVKYLKVLDFSIEQFEEKVF